ncbi:hypothetical protein Ancab_035997 [Ancistrocladus abbreviatus]
MGEDVDDGFLRPSGPSKTTLIGLGRSTESPFADWAQCSGKRGVAFSSSPIMNGPIRSCDGEPSQLVGAEGTNAHVYSRKKGKRTSISIVEPSQAHTGVRSGWRAVFGSSFALGAVQSR